MLFFYLAGFYEAERIGTYESATQETENIEERIRNAYGTYRNLKNNFVTKDIDLTRTPENLSCL